MVELGYQGLADANVAVYHHKLDVHDVMRTIAQHEEAQVSVSTGTMCHDPSAYREGLSDARKLFDIGIELGHKMRIVDIGGGFPGQVLPGKATFDQMVGVIEPASKEFFSEKEYPNLEITAEPSRFFSTEPVCVVVHVIGATKVPASRITKKEEDKNKVGYMYYVNDGVYGSFNTIAFNDRLPVGIALRTPGGTENGPTANYEKKDEEETFPSIVWGPTCDGIDKIEENIQMPKLTIEDWIYYPHMGVYTTVAASKFNGFDAPRPYYIIGSNAWESIYGKDQEANQ
ncbi:pyridoxal-dependent decarboxylase, pyridoxal binding domain-containing protein [Ditylenchus destructor]|uniref:Pyridoxal-dependent decarboxylase, pyridoxal binding domain-containing protein n=1 Tax=Ditylenchus destructor TaxID=166010 RepID=A0AAD4MYH3_9BILA|nr:pyridoxal-dependent decarboxylase, pyridoxal binding domain-containing protein [Ditylenchus destructor]